MVNDREALSGRFLWTYKGRGMKRPLTHSIADRRYLCRPHVRVIMLPPIAGA